MKIKRLRIIGPYDLKETIVSMWRLEFRLVFGMRLRWKPSQKQLMKDVRQTFDALPQEEKDEFINALRTHDDTLP